MSIDEPGAAPQQTSIRLSHNQQLPTVCSCCGTFTDRFVRVVREISRRKEQDRSAELLLLGLFSWTVVLLAWLRGDFRSRVKDTVRVEMPQCEFCGENGPPIPTTVNSEEYQMTFVVHRDFKACVLRDGVKV